MDSPVKRAGALFFDLLQTIVLALAIFMLVYLFAAQPHQVQGSSMYPNFEDKEYFLTDKISYRLHLPQRGDVIVFEAPADRKKDYIKRIVGLPGETVKVQGGKVYVNDELLNEKYLDNSVMTSGKIFLSEGVAYTTASDEYFVMGDNRDHSSDSREWGPVKRDELVGRAWLVYWPPSKVGFIP